METLENFSTKAAHLKVSQTNFDKSIAAFAKALSWNTGKVDLDEFSSTLSRLFDKPTGQERDDLDRACHILATIALLIHKNNTAFVEIAEQVPIILRPLVIWYEIAVKTAKFAINGNTDDDDDQQDEQAMALVAKLVTKIEAFVKKTASKSQVPPIRLGSIASFYVIKLPYVVYRKGKALPDMLVVKVGIAGQTGKRLEQHSKHFERTRTVSHTRLRTKEKHGVQEELWATAGLTEVELDEGDEFQFHVPKAALNSYGTEAFDYAKDRALTGNFGKSLEMDLSCRLDGISAFELGDETVPRKYATQAIAAAAFGLKSKSFGYTEIYVLSKAGFTALKNNFTDHLTLLTALDEVVEGERRINCYIQLHKERKIHFGGYGLYD